MFQTLTHNLTKIFDRLTKSGTLTENQINEAMHDIRIALLEADVALPVVKDFIHAVKIKALGQKIIEGVFPGQMVVKIIHNELINILASPKEDLMLQLQSKKLTNILVTGLQGSGKTTLCAKIALLLKNQNKKLLLVSLDTYRPAAQQQLAILSESIAVDCLPIISHQTPLAIAKRALAESKLVTYDVVIYDTAGRLQIDEEMMEEVLNIKNLIIPSEILLAVDAMIGQESVNIANSFNQKLDITGVILTRVDGDAKGGAALSIKHVTKKPIKFLSTGEKLTNLEEFDAERIASRILDMGDILSLVEKASSVIDQEEAEKTAAKLKKGRFDLGDYLSQLKSIKKLGFANIISMLPGFNKNIDTIDPLKLNNKMIEHQEAIISSMTPKERAHLEILNGSRRKRIAYGSGTSVQKVNQLIKQFKHISGFIKKTSNMEKKSLMRMRLSKLFK